MAKKERPKDYTDAELYRRERYQNRTNWYKENFDRPVGRGSFEDW